MPGCTVTATRADVEAVESVYGTFSLIARLGLVLQVEVERRVDLVGRRAAAARTPSSTSGVAGSSNWFWMIQVT